MLTCDWCKEKVPALDTHLNLVTVGDDGETFEYDEDADLCDHCRRKVRRQVKAAWKDVAPKVKPKR